MLRLVALFLSSVLLAFGQATTPVLAKPDAVELAKLFGSAFTAQSEFPVLTADFDGDGAEDAVVVATAENPLLDEGEFHYKVVDPYSSYYGLGDPKVTVHFSTHVGKPHFLLVVHNWRAPKAKFVIMNFPFDKLSLSRTLVKKKPVPAIKGEEVTGETSLVFWDGKKWKWANE
jgi:hypothetical protein